jgi:hypothetical protein
MKKANFKSKQVVCIQGLDLPMGCVVLKLKLSQDFWLGTVEQDNQAEDREFSSGELRPLTQHEIGPREARKKT